MEAASISLNMSQMLTMVVAALVGVVWKSLNDKFQGLREDYTNKLGLTETGLKDKLQAQRELLEERANTRQHQMEERLAHRDQGLVSLQATLSALTAEIKEIRLSLAKSFLTKEEHSEFMKQEAKRLENRLQDAVGSPPRQRSR